MSAGYGCATLREVRDSPTALLRYLFVFTDGGALAVSEDGHYLHWVEDDFDPWVLARQAGWEEVGGRVRFTVAAVCLAVDAALHEGAASCEHDLCG